jgi:outer membrane protein OmpA-like peptidoglycan-associated protein
MRHKVKKIFQKKAVLSIIIFILFLSGLFGCALDKTSRRKAELDELQKEFSWWPTDAKPSPVKDEERGGYWWWPNQPGKVMPWGNRGYVYVYKIIFDYKAEELPPPKPKELRPSLLIKKIIKNVKIYFDYNKADLRDDAAKILENAVSALNKNPETSILITGNCDIRGSETYNEKLGKQRGEAVRKFMLDNGISENRIRIVSRGKLDAVAPITDLVGMQKDRNAQFMIAEVEEVMIPAPDLPQIQQEAKPVEEGKYIIEKEEHVESAVKVSQKEYIIKKGDSLWKIAEKELGSGHRWKYLYELNKERIKNPDKLKAGQKIIIPVE